MDPDPCSTVGDRLDGFGSGSCNLAIPELYGARIIHVQHQLPRWCCEVKEDFFDNLKNDITTEIASVEHDSRRKRCNYWKTNRRPKYWDYDFWGRYDRLWTRLWYYSIRKPHSFKVGGIKEPRFITRQEVAPTLVPSLLKVLQDAFCHGHSDPLGFILEPVENPP
jgi:hypothetical protein